MFSDTLGWFKPQAHQQPGMTTATVGHSHVFRLLARWAKEDLPPHERQAAECYTTIAVNRGYAAKAHRDTGNAGPSLTRSCGNFKGGMLRYWPADNGKAPLCEVKGTPSRTLDTRTPTFFDGRKCHEVQPFTGERFSVVLFVGSGLLDAAQECRATAQLEHHVRWPFADDMAQLETVAENAELVRTTNLKERVSRNRAEALKRRDGKRKVACFAGKQCASKCTSKLEQMQAISSEMSHIQGGQTFEESRKRFRDAVLKWHPDKNKENGAIEVFRGIMRHKAHYW